MVHIFYCSSYIEGEKKKRAELGIDPESVPLQLQDNSQLVEIGNKALKIMCFTRLVFFFFLWGHERRCFVILSPSGVWLQKKLFTTRLFFPAVKDRTIVCCWSCCAKLLKDCFLSHLEGAALEGELVSSLWKEVKCSVTVH